MKKVLTITLLVLLAVGLFVSCNADAVEAVYESEGSSGDCYVGSVEILTLPITVAFVKDSNSNWWIICGSHQSGDEQLTCMFFLNTNQSGDIVSTTESIEGIDFSFSLSSKKLELTGTLSVTCVLNSATIKEIADLQEIFDYQIQERSLEAYEGTNLLICECKGTEYKFVAGSD